MGKEFFQVHKHVLLGDEAHLHVHLGKFGLAVGAQVLVAEAARHLIVAVDAAHHQKLLEDLRRLGQGVERARVHAAGHQVVARALGGGLGEHRRFHLQKAAFVEEFLRRLDKAGAEAQRLEHLRPPQIQIAEAQAQFLAHMRRVLQREGRGVGAGEKRQARGVQLHRARGNERIDRFRIAQAHHAPGAHHAFGAHMARQFKHLRGQGALVAHHLHHALAVAHIQKYHAAHIAHGVHPTGHRRALAHMFGAEQAAIARSHHCIIASSEQYKKPFASGILSGGRRALQKQALRGATAVAGARPACSAGTARKGLYRGGCNAPRAAGSTDSRRGVRPAARSCSSPENLCRAPTNGGSLERPFPGTRLLIAGDKNYGMDYTPVFRRCQVAIL